jgi:Fe-S oxidoreductase
MMSPTGLSYWGVPGYIIFWVLGVVAVTLFLLRASKLWRYLMLGKPWEKIDRLPKRLLSAFFHIVQQWCQFKTLSRQDYSGMGHVLMAWGFFIFIIYYFLFIIVGAGFGVSAAMENNRFFYYYAWVMDIAAPLVMLAALWGITRRYIIRPARLKGEQTVEAAVILVTVFMHPVTHLFKEATAIALGQAPAGLGSSLPFISSALSKLFSGNTLSSIQAANAGFFWAHWTIVLFVLVFIAYSRYLHILAAPFNILLRPSRPQGALKPVDFETNEAFGVSNVSDLSRKQLLESYSCVVCGRCQDACPAYATGKPLNPKKVIQDIKEHLLQVGPTLLDKAGGAAADNPGKALVGEVITEGEMLACTTCGACVETCPVLNDHVGTIVDLRRKLVYEGTFDKGHKRALQRVARDYNPWGLRWNSRARNIGIEEARETEKYDCIYWLGCVASFDERVREVAQATAKILKAAGLRFAILGARERCCGDFVRRIGDEGLFQRLAKENIETLHKFNFDFILTHCPHGYNTIKNEYPQFGGNFRVVHHTQLILDLLNEGKIQLQESSQESREKIIYHDPCYLGRYNGIYAEPRQILRQICGEITEFPRNRNRSFCCGAGGGNTWTEQEAGSRISVARLEEAIKADIQTLVTSCPFCFLMFQEAIQIKGSGDAIILKDLAEVVWRETLVK